MMAPDIHCSVVQVPEYPIARNGEVVSAARELLPWADPYIASLIRMHQAQWLREQETRDRVEPGKFNTDSTASES